MSTQVVPVSEVETYLVESQHKIQGLLPKHLTAERMIRLAVHACERNTALLKCSKPSLLGALIEASEVGLEPVGVLGEAAIIPYKGVATFQPMYKGLIKLARQAGKVIDIHAECVGENDEFEFYHATPMDVLHHRPSLTGRGKWIGVWARAILPEDVVKILYYDREKIERIRSMSKEPDGLMWGEHWDEGAKKTVIKALCKTLPQSRELSRAIDIDNQVDVGDLGGSPVDTPIMQMPRRLSESQASGDQPASPPPIPKSELKPPACPEHGPMSLRDGKYGPFYGCERGCKKVKNINAENWAKEQAAKAAEAPMESVNGCIPQDQIAELQALALKADFTNEGAIEILGKDSFESWEEITVELYPKVKKRFEAFLKTEES